MSLVQNSRALIFLVFAAFGVASCDSPENSTDTLQPVTRAWMVMGTTLEITLYRPEVQALQALADLEAAHALIAAFDRSMSLYKPDSDIVSLNARAGSGPVSISDSFYNILVASNYYANLSAGAFDITVQPLVELWGFYRNTRQILPPQEDVDTVLKRVSYKNVVLNKESKSVSLEKGIAIDLGGIAKGFAIDDTVELLKSRGVTAALINLGGTVAVFGPAPSGDVWSVGIQHPRENRLIGRIRLTDGAVSTSGDYDRFFEVDGVRYNHLIDPRSGWPVPGLNAVTVVAPTATAADALSTAVFVLGAEKGLKLLSGCLGTYGVFIRPTDNKDSADNRLNAIYTQGGNADDVTLLLDNVDTSLSVFSRSDAVTIDRLKCNPHS
ncbi:MAG: FAD:protein FMN transferase [Rhodospirillaceae bacterium]